eukprot:762884-Rhodomonas_salina.1
MEVDEADDICNRRRTRCVCERGAGGDGGANLWEGRLLCKLLLEVLRALQRDRHAQGGGPHWSQLCWRCLVTSARAFTRTGALPKAHFYEDGGAAAVELDDDYEHASQGGEMEVDQGDEA